MRKHPLWKSVRWPAIVSALSIAATIISLLLDIPQLFKRARKLAIEESPTLTITKESTLTATPAATFNLVGIYRTSRNANDIFVANNVAYLANGGNGLVMLDVSVPSEPAVIGQHQLENARSVVVADNIAYVIQEGTLQDNRQLRDRLVLIDVSTPSDPKVIGEYESSGLSRSIYHVAVAVDLLYLTGHSYLEILDGSNPSRPTKIWGWATPSNSGNPCNAHVIGETLYMTGGWTGVFIFDTEDPHNPTRIGQFDTPDWAIDIAVVDGIAYVTLGEAGLITLDVSDPPHPTMMGRYNIPGFASALSVLNDVAYVTYLVYEGYDVVESGLVAIDVEDPYNLTTIDKYANMDSATDVHAVDDLIYATDEIRGVIVLRLESAD